MFERASHWAVQAEVTRYNTSQWYESGQESVMKGQKGDMDRDSDGRTRTTKGRKRKDIIKGGLEVETEVVVG